MISSSENNNHKEKVMCFGMHHFSDYLREGKTRNKKRINSEGQIILCVQILDGHF